MEKYLKISAMSLIIILSIMVGLRVQAEDTPAVACTLDAKVCPDGSSVGRVAPDCKFAACPGETTKDRRVENRLENKAKVAEVKTEIKDLKNNFETKREEHRVVTEAMVKSIKDSRQAFKIEIEAKKAEFNLKLEDLKTKFKDSLKVIKDENKKVASEKIVTLLNDLNTKRTEELSNKIDQIENVLISIESRINKAEVRDLNISSVKDQAAKAKTAIKAARTAIENQIDKSYTTEITSETTLKAQMQTLRESFKTDIETVREAVKAAHQAVKNTAETLAKIPKIDEEIVVEDNKNTN